MDCSPSGASVYGILQARKLEWVCQSLAYSDWYFPSSSAGKESACNAGDLGLIPGSGRTLEKEMAYSDCPQDKTAE